MSNSLNQNPIIISSTFATSYKAAVQVAPGSGGVGVGSQLTIRIAKIYWENPGTIGDTFVIEDPISSLILWTGRCEVANQSQLFDWTARPLIWQDFCVPTLASGTLYISVI